MNREERERTQGQWRRPRTAAEKGWVRIQSHNIHLVRQGLPVRWYGFSRENPVESMGGFTNSPVDGMVMWSLDGIQPCWGMNVESLDDTARLEVQFP